MENDLIAMMAVAGLVCTGMVFAVAGAQKLRHRSVLRGVIANYRLLPEVLVAPAAAILPPVEVVLGLVLLCGVARPFAPLAAMALLAVFAAAMAVNILRGRAEIDCGCNQVFLRQPLRWTLVLRNLMLAAVLLPSLAIAAPVPVAALVTGAAGGAAFFLLYLLVNIFAALPRRELMAGART